MPRANRGENGDGPDITVNQQLGMVDIPITDDADLYHKLLEWHRAEAKYQSLNAGAADKARKDAKQEVIDLLSLSDDAVQRFRVSLNGEPDTMVFVLTATPPAEKTKQIPASTKAYNHRFKLDTVE